MRSTIPDLGRPRFIQRIASAAGFPSLEHLAISICAAAAFAMVISILLGILR